MMRDSAQLLLMVHQGLCSAGIDVNAVVHRLGYQLEAFSSREKRMPHHLQVAFWQTVEEISKDPDIGLHLCPHLPAYRGEVLEYLMFSSRTLGEGADRVTRYLRLLSDALSIKVRSDKDTAYVDLVATANDVPQARHTEICVMYELIGFIRNISDGTAAPKRVYLRWAPIAPEEDYRRIFGAEVSFDTQSKVNVVEWPSSMMEFRSPHWDPALLALHEQYADKRLAELERQDLIGEIRQILARRLETGAYELPDVARELDMTPRAMRKQLEQADTSFSEILNDYRYSLSRRLLARTDERIDDIAYLTGFSEPSTFYRAFKRWSGMTPTQYRSHHANAEDGLA